jgi:hypothetical protein
VFVRACKKQSTLCLRLARRQAHLRFCLSACAVAGAGNVPPAFDHTSAPHVLVLTNCSVSTGGAYDDLTLWEQIDMGAQYTPAKKWLTSVPICL